MTYLITLLLLLLSSEIIAKPKCPSGCICDNLSKLRRLKCSNKNLVHIIGAVSSKVQVLDVSYNQIQQIGDHELLDWELTSMKILNISHNKLAHIHLNGFREMDEIRIIDMSYNSLAYLLLEWFYNLYKLKELYLNNNNFASLPEGPILESDSLEILDLSNSRISHLKRDAFTKLPNLQKLYLKGNFLIEVKIITLSPLKNLQVLSLEENPLKCDQSTDDVKNYLQKSLFTNVVYKDSCKKESEKFQRMMVEPEKTTEQINTWILDEETEDGVSVIYNCTKTSILENHKGLLLEIIELSPILAILIPFLIGTVFGLILGCSIQIKPKNKKIKRQKRFSYIRRNHTDFFPLVLNCESTFESTPMPHRRFLEANSL